MNFKIFNPATLIFILIIFANICGWSSSNCSQLISDKKENNFMQSDSSRISSVVYIEGKGFIAFDKEGNELFEVFLYDNGPDYPSEGIFRIIENGKIGYADELGNVVIKPQFKAALPFQNGMAAFCDECSETVEDEHRRWEGGKWGFVNNLGKIAIPARFDRIVEQFENGVAKVEYSGSVILINKKGEQVKMNNIEYNRWINLLGCTTKLAAKLFFGNKIIVELKWLSNDKFIFTANDYSEYLRINILDDENRELLEYNIIPWQNFAVKHGSDFLISMEEVSTVTDYAIIYSIFKPREKNKNDMRIIEKFNNLFTTILERDINHQLEDNQFDYPENVQFISKKVYRYYADLQIAVPGTVMPDESKWMNICKGKMLYIQLIPDIFEIKKRWIKTSAPPTDTYYTSVEDDLLKYFDEALKDTYNSPNRRNEIFENTKLKMRKLFSAANSYVNFLYDEYEERLKRWLFVGKQTTDFTNEENIFGDYQPKHTPDTVLDYMPSLSEDVEKLPHAELENFSNLLRLLKHYQEASKRNLGHWEDGNMILGAQPREYKPSKDELLVSEVGDRLVYIIRNKSKKINEFLRKEEIILHELEYTKYSFTHVDVMGSGRFFYVLNSKKINLDLEKVE